MESLNFKQLIGLEKDYENVDTSDDDSQSSDEKTILKNLKKINQNIK